MSDLALTAAWTAVLVVALGGAVGARAAGLASTYVRDLLHVGAGVWVLGWTAWHGAVAPIVLVAVVTVAVASVPALASRVGIARRFRDAVAGGDERFSGLVVYVFAYLVLTAVGLLYQPFPAAAGLLALSLGDGLGGAFGRRFGRHRFQLPFGKRKSLEGSVTVALAATCGAAIAGSLFGVALEPWQLAALGGVAAVAEAVAPRSGDNALVPAAVWLAATLVT